MKRMHGWILYNRINNKHLEKKIRWILIWLPAVGYQERKSESCKVWKCWWFHAKSCHDAAHCSVSCSVTWLQCKTNYSMNCVVLSKNAKYMTKKIFHPHLYVSLNSPASISIKMNRDLSLWIFMIINVEINSLT